MSLRFLQQFTCEMLSISILTPLILNHQGGEMANHSLQEDGDLYEESPFHANKLPMAVSGYPINRRALSTVSGANSETSNNSPLNPLWVTGFADAESSFNCI
jgi:hypothetical protein